MNLRIFDKKITDTDKKNYENFKYLSKEFIELLKNIRTELDTPAENKNKKKSPFMQYFEYSNEMCQKLLADNKLGITQKYDLEKLEDMLKKETLSDTLYNFQYSLIELDVQPGDPHLNKINECLSAGLEAFKIPNRLTQFEGADIMQNKKENNKALRHIQTFFSSANDLYQIKKMNNPSLRQYSLIALETAAFGTTLFIGSQVALGISAGLAAIAIGSLTCGVGLGVVAACLLICAGARYLQKHQDKAEERSKAFLNLKENCKEVAKTLKVDKDILKLDKENRHRPSSFELDNNMHKGRRK